MTPTSAQHRRQITSKSPPHVLSRSLTSFIQTQDSSAQNSLAVLAAVVKLYRREMVKREKMSVEERRDTQHEHEQSIMWLQYRARTALDAYYQ
jgi:hypothetical protein